MNQTTIEVNRDIRAERRAAAERFRQQMTAQKTFVVRLLSSPGSGKTTLLEKTAQHLAADFRIGVLVGDVETDRDAQRLAPFCPSHQITTGGACHLELPLVERALPQLGSEPLDFMFIEDVGNLICPASHELGEHRRIIVLSTTEGDDKPGKYPKAFRTSQVTVITKTDLLPHLPFSVEAAEDDIRDVQPGMTVFILSALSGEGMDQWTEYLIDEREKVLRSAADATKQ